MSNSSLNIETFIPGQAPLSYSQAVQQVVAENVPTPEARLDSPITLVEELNPTHITDRSIVSIRAIAVEDVEIHFEPLDLTSLLFEFDRLLYKCVSVNNKITDSLISDHLFFTDHAIDRMEERQISYEKVCYTLSARPIESYDNKWVLNDNIEGIATVVKSIESIGYIVTTVIQKLSIAVNAELLEFNISLDPIHGDEVYETLDELEQFYQRVFKDENESKHRRSKSAFNLAVILDARCNIMNEAYQEQWLLLIKRALLTGHPCAQLYYAYKYLKVFPPQLQAKESTWYNALKKDLLAAGELQNLTGESYTTILNDCKAITNKSPLLAPKLTTLLWIIAGNKKAIPFNLLFKLFLMRNPKAILFLLANYDNKEIFIVKENSEKKYLISELFEKEVLKTTFHSFPSCVQNQTINDGTEEALYSINKIVHKKNQAFCESILGTALLKYGAEFFHFLESQKKLAELEIQQRIEVTKNFTFLTEFYIDYINKEKGSSILAFANLVNGVRICLLGHTGIVVYQTSRLLKALVQEAKDAEGVKVVFDSINNLVSRSMKEFLSSSDQSLLGNANMLKSVNTFLKYLVENTQSLGESIELYTGMLRIFQEYPSLQAFLSLILAQILYSEGDIEATKNRIEEAFAYCALKAKSISKNKKRGQSNHETKFVWHKGDIGVSKLFIVIKDFQNELPRE